MKELLFGVPVVIFLLWILSAPVPAQRIERGCEPINWVGNLATSATALAVDDKTVTAARWSVKLNYSCQYLVWRLFYQDAYNKAVAEGRVVPANQAGQPAGTPAKQEGPTAAEAAADAAATEDAGK